MVAIEKKSTQNSVHLHRNSKIWPSSCKK